MRNDWSFCAKAVVPKHAVAATMAIACSALETNRTMRMGDPNPLRIYGFLRSACRFGAVPLVGHGACLRQWTGLAQIRDVARELTPEEQVVCQQGFFAPKGGLGG